MNRVALGRALGFGARQAARTLMKVADAATTPAPASQTSVPARPAAQTVRPAVAARVQTVRQAGSHAKGIGSAVLKPVARFTSVLWLEVTGLFYGVFAALLCAAAWRQWGLAYRNGLALAGAGERTRFFIYAAVGAVFAYFSLTNFLKARRRGRR